MAFRLPGLNEFVSWLLSAATIGAVQTTEHPINHTPVKMNCLRSAQIRLLVISKEHGTHHLCVCLSVYLSVCRLELL